MDKYYSIEAISSKKLWNHFQNIASDELKYKVRQLLIHASTKLSAIRETFPTYTIHDGQHQYNMLSNVELLMGERLHELSSTESAFLLLSIYYHDIGMVYSADELMNISNSRYFHKFLNENISANISFLKSNKLVNEDLAEWYCRWAHAVRVHDELKKLDQDLIIWENIPIGLHLGYVCESHNWRVIDVRNNVTLNNNFLGNCDLKFICILLRLSDILDFDYTRAPKSLYQYLNLENANSYSTQISKNEWRKHLNSNGFKLSDDNVKLIFSAGPTNPDIEFSIREFLKLIEKELSECNSIKYSLNRRWNNITIPKEIDKEYIISNDYLFGDFELSIQKDKIFQIFIGENLYQSRSTFIRELLQNAIDTTRLRIVYEKYLNNNVDFKTPEIEIDYWVENSRYYWFKISDHGMGMDPYKIMNYFLKVGNSYYTSTEFEKFVFDLKLKNIDFIPISRFGIGFLSCFMVSDEILVNTYDRLSDSKYSLKINGKSNYYIFKTESHTPFTFPERLNQPKENFRSKFGTSIYVKIDKLIYNELDKIEDHIKLYYSHSDIALKINGKVVLNSFLLAKSKNKYSVATETVEEINNYLGDKIFEDLSIIVEAIDINEYLDINNIKGTVIISRIESNNPLTGKNWKLLLNDYFTIYAQKKGKPAKSFKFEEVKSIFLKLGINEEIINNNLKLSHNGITLPLEKTRGSSVFQDEEIEFLSIMLNSDHEDFFMFFKVDFFDDYRPDLFITRESLKPLSWNIYSALSFIVYSSIKLVRPKVIFESLEFAQFYIVPSKYLTNEVLSQDKLISNLEYWPSKELFYFEGNYVSLNTLKNMKLSSKNIEELIFFDGGGNFETTLPKKILEDSFNFKLNTHKMELEIKLKSANEVNKYIYFPPLMFIEYDNDEKLFIDDYPLNSNHKIIRWIIEYGQYLKLNYQDYLLEIINVLEQKYLCSNKKLNSLLLNILNDLVSLDNTIKQSLTYYKIIKDSD